MKLPVFADLSDITLQHADLMPDLPAIRFQFRFTGTARADSAAETGEVRALSGQSRELVFQLREFDLELAFLCAGAAGEDVEDEAGAIHDLCLQSLFEVPRLAGREFLVEDDDIDALDKNLLAQFLDLTFSDIRRWIGPITL